MQFLDKLGVAKSLIPFAVTLLLLNGFLTVVACGNIFHNLRYNNGVLGKVEACSLTGAGFYVCLE